MVKEGERRVALVTGAADGLGAGAATRLVRDGWVVLLFDRDSRVTQTAERIRAEHGAPFDTVLPRVGDVTSEEDVTAAVSVLESQFDRLDLAVANAGVTGEGIELCDVTLADFDRVIGVNLLGVYLTCRAAGRKMREARSGCIITTSSIFGVEPVPGAAAYCASKAAVIALTKTMSLEMAPYGVRVNSIAPGYMHTEMQWQAIRNKAEVSGRSFEDERQEIVDFVPMGRHGEPADFGGAVAFLASEDAAYITGHTLGVTGGVVNW
jgi:NAD(P)-dependent dehydrogenase (short-subunit alcohol dehydrogenase family)